MKTKEELNELKSEFESLKIKLAELSDEELAQVVGGTVENGNCPYGKTKADQECNFVNRNKICLHATASVYSEYVYTTYICDKGCGEFDNDLRDF